MSAARLLLRSLTARPLHTIIVAGLGPAIHRAEAPRASNSTSFERSLVDGTRWGRGYLINQFLAPNSNTRTDIYGGRFENRTRFMVGVLREIRSKCGPGFTGGMRMNGEDYIDDGWGIDEALRLAPLLEQNGADYLNVSAGVYGSRQLTIPSMYVEQGCFVHLDEAMKKRVSIPVVAVGRIKTPDMADSIIRDNKADMIALGRSLLADPQWTNKAKSGSVRTIRPCIGCCLGCIHAVFQLEPGGCVVNPDVGR